LTASAYRLPAQVQSAAYLNERLQRPPGWLEDRAGIGQRRVWGEQDPLAAAADAGRECLERAGMKLEDVGALLVTSEAPPLLAGLAAAVHHRLGLPAQTMAEKIGNACSGFLAALWLGRQLILARKSVLVLAVEAPTRYLALQPGPAGEAAALFGDAAAACLLADQPCDHHSLSLVDILLRVDGAEGRLIQVAAAEKGAVEVRLQGEPLAARAIDAMAQAVQDLAAKHGLALADLAAIVMHGGNARFPALLARRLGLPAERVWSQTAQTGNLGSASLPVAWALQEARPEGPIIWTAVGAGLTWGAVLFRTSPARR